MRIASWLRSLRVPSGRSCSLNSSGSRCRARRGHGAAALAGSPMTRAATDALDPVVETLEDRSLPSVFALFFSETLDISMDADDNVSVGNDGSGNVQVMANGSPLSIGSVAVDSVQAIVVNGSDSNNTLDLSG